MRIGGLLFLVAALGCTRSPGPDAPLVQLEPPTPDPDAPRLPDPSPAPSGVEPGGSASPNLGDAALDRDPPPDFLPAGIACGADWTAPLCPAGQLCVSGRCQTPVTRLWRVPHGLEEPGMRFELRLPPGELPDNAGLWLGVHHRRWGWLVSDRAPPRQTDAWGHVWRMEERDLDLGFVEIFPQLDAPRGTDAGPSFRVNSRPIPTIAEGADCDLDDFDVACAAETTCVEGRCRAHAPEITNAAVIGAGPYRVRFDVGDVDADAAQARLGWLHEDEPRWLDWTDINRSQPAQRWDERGLPRSAENVLIQAMDVGGRTGPVVAVPVDAPAVADEGGECDGWGIDPVCPRRSTCHTAGEIGFGTCYALAQCPPPVGGDGEPAGEYGVGLEPVTLEQPTGIIARIGARYPNVVGRIQVLAGGRLRFEGFAAEWDGGEWAPAPVYLVPVCRGPSVDGGEPVDEVRVTQRDLYDVLVDAPGAVRAGTFRVVVTPL